MNAPRGRLAIDIGPVTTVAALERGGQRWAVLFGDQVTVATPRVDGGDGRDLVTALGRAGGQAAEPIIAAVAEHLRAVAATATHAGPSETTAVTTPVTVVTVPPSWGPRHQDMIRRAAVMAGLDPVQVVSEAAAVAAHAFPDTPQDGVVLVCQLGQRASQVTVLQRHPGGWTWVATRPVAATGDRLDEALAEAVMGQTRVTDRVAAQLAQARAQLAAGAPVAAVAPGGSAAVQISAEMLQQKMQPLHHAVCEAVADVLDAADIESVRLHASVVYGECADVLTPSPQQQVWAEIKAVTAADGRLAAVYGALASDAPDVAASAVSSSGVRRGWARYVSGLVAPLLCGAAGAVLLWQIFEIVARLMPPSFSRQASDYQKLQAYFDTAAFATAGWLLTLGSLTVGRILAVSLLADGSNGSGGGSNGSGGGFNGSGSPSRRAGQVYAFSAVVGLAFAVLQGLLGQAIVGGPVEWAPPYLTSALAGALAPAIVAMVIGLAAPWLGERIPWTERVDYPVGSAVLAAVGIAALNARSYGLPLPGLPGVVSAVLGICGAGLLGVAIALTVVAHRAARFVLGMLMAAACMVIVGFSNLHSVIVVYLIIVGLWWIRRGARIIADNVPRRWWLALGQVVRDGTTEHDPR